MSRPTSSTRLLPALSLLAALLVLVGVGVFAAGRILDHRADHDSGAAPPRSRSAVDSTQLRSQLPRARDMVMDDARFSTVATYDSVGPKPDTTCPTRSQLTALQPSGVVRRDFRNSGRRADYVGWVMQFDDPSAAAAAQEQLSHNLEDCFTRHKKAAGPYSISKDGRTAGAFMTGLTDVVDEETGRWESCGWTRVGDRLLVLNFSFLSPEDHYAAWPGDDTGLPDNPLRISFPRAAARLG